MIPHMVRSETHRVNLFQQKVSKGDAAGVQCRRSKKAKRLPASPAGSHILRHRKTQSE